MGLPAIKRLLPVVCTFLIISVLLSGGCGGGSDDGNAATPAGNAPETQSSNSGIPGGPIVYVTKDLTMIADQNNSIQLEANGGEPPYSWRVKAGFFLPSGFQLTSKGVLRGSPSLTGEAAEATTPPFIVIIRDSAGDTAEAEIALHFVRQ